MRDAQTSKQPPPHHSAPPHNKVKSLLEYLDNPPPQRDSLEALPSEEDPATKAGPRPENTAAKEFTSTQEESPAGGSSGENAAARSEGDFVAEARRIAAELLKLYHVGVIAGADDPNLAFYACLIRDLGGTVLPPQDIQSPDTGPYVPTEEQRVHIPYGLTYAERQQFLQEDVDSLNDEAE
jgi:hypothetical protein